MRVLVCGDSKWTYRFLEDGVALDKERNQREWNAIWHELKSLPSDSVIIASDGNGASKGCSLVAKKVGLKVMPFTIMWGLHGKKAGPMCNERMFREGKPQLVLVFHDDLYHDNGTKHLVAIAREADIPVRIITGKEG